MAWTHHRVALGVPKGWLAGDWESILPVSASYAFEGIDEPHVHPALTAALSKVFRTPRRRRRRVFFWMTRTV